MSHGVRFDGHGWSFEDPDPATVAFYDRDRKARREAAIDPFAGAGYAAPSTVECQSHRYGGGRCNRRVAGDVDPPLCGYHVARLIERAMAQQEGRR